MSEYTVPSVDTTRGSATLLGANRALRLRNAVPKGVALWIRQSSRRQVAENIGSQLFQKGQLSFLKHFGIEPECIQQYVTQYDARGRSAREGVERPNFERLLAGIQAGEVGVVLVAFLDRHSRNKRDSERLYDALAKHRGILVQQGNIYDPHDQNDRFFLEMKSLMAWFDNAQRSLRMVTSKAALAASLGLRIALPRGLCWASPDDPHYVRCAKQAGIEGHLGAEALREHRVRSRQNGTEFYILPYPDAEVQRAVRLTAEWTLETRSLREVTARIRSHPAWPRPGQFPASRPRRFRRADQDEPTPCDDLWQPLVDRPDGRDDLASGVLRDWLRSPALYGIYAFDLPALREQSPAAADAIGVTTWEENAFPALIDPDVRQQIDEIVGNPLDAFVNHRYEGPRNHALPEVRCAAFLPNGERCGLKRHVTYRSNRERHRYQQSACSRRGHLASFSQHIEQPVLEMVTEAYGDCQLEEALAHIRERRGVAEQSRRRITQKLEETTARVESATRLLENAQHAGNHDVVEHWTTRLEEHLDERARLRKELARLEEQIERAGSLEQQDVARLRELATDVPRLLDLAAKVEKQSIERTDGGDSRHEGLRRRLLAQLTRGVHVRSLGYRCLDVQVEFPSGARRRRVVFARAGRVGQAAAAFAYLHLGIQAEPEGRNTLEAERAVRDSAEEVAHTYNGVLEAAGLSGSRVWDADRALMAALQHQHMPAELKVRPDLVHHESARELADRLSLPVHVALTQGLTGGLGPARVYDERLVFRPTLAELHKAFPDVACRWVAQQQGWKLADTVLVSEIRDENDWSWGQACHRARRWGGIARDKGGRRYTCQNLAAPGRQEKLLALLNAHLPAGIDISTGRWLPLTDALDELGVHRQTIQRHRTEGATIVRPGRGYLGSRSVYVWVDKDFVRLCAKVSR